MAPTTWRCVQQEKVDETGPESQVTLKHSLSLRGFVSVDGLGLFTLASLATAVLTAFVF